MRKNGKRAAANAERGFTLIELVTVIVVLGILSAVAIPAGDLTSNSVSGAITDAVGNPPGDSSIAQFIVNELRTNKL